MRAYCWLLLSAKIVFFFDYSSKNKIFFTFRDENVTCRKVFVISCKRLEKKSLLVIKYILYNSSIFATEKKFVFFKNRLGLLIVRFINS